MDRHWVALTMRRLYAGRTFCVEVQEWEDGSEVRTITLFHPLWHTDAFDKQTMDACERYEAETFEEILEQIAKAERREDSDAVQ